MLFANTLTTFPGLRALCAGLSAIIFSKTTVTTTATKTTTKTKGGG